MRTFVLLALVLTLPGCVAAAPLATPAVEGAATLAGTAGTTATSYVSTESTTQLNKANVELIHAQAALMEAQARDLNFKRKEMAHERATVVGILRDQALANHDYTLADLAMWVEAGGDPQFAMKYMLDHQTKLVSASDSK
jgi:hypothetical protein